MSLQDDVDVLGFEMARRVVLFRSTTLLSDKTTRLGFNGDPNDATTATTGEQLLRDSPTGTMFIQDDGTMWRKTVNTTETKTWVLMGEGSGGGGGDNTSELHVINRGSFDLNMYSCPGEPHFLTMQENNFAADTTWGDVTYHHTLLLPYDATVERVVLRGSATNGATVIVGMHTNKDVIDTGTIDYKFFPETPHETSTNTHTDNNQSMVYTFTEQASARFGDTLGVSLSADRPTGNMNATIVLRYDTTESE